MHTAFGVATARRERIRLSAGRVERPGRRSMNTNVESLIQEHVIQYEMTKYWPFVKRLKTQ